MKTAVLVPIVAALSLLNAAASAQQSSDLATTYRPAADKLITAALADTEGYANLTYLCDHIGNRISGSDSLARAITWSADLMRREGLANVHTEPVMVPHWVRGQESASLLSPIARPLHMLGLGMSVATPPGGITAEVVVVPDFEALTKLGRSAVAGRIVVFNAPYVTYGQTVRYRVAGPSRAAALGAVAVLVRSITPLVEQTPHTGTTGYDPAQPRIPAAAISPEDAMLLDRLSHEPHAAPIKVHLAMQAHLAPDSPSFNVIGEITGREHPEEIVVLGGHIDSWDVGQGAQDDGSGIMATLEAVNLIKRLGMTPRRTVRLVFWVNEENGGAGGRAYAKSLGAQAANHVAAIEMDGGAEPPIGFGYGAAQPGTARRAPVSTGVNPPTGPSPAEVRSLALLQQIATLLKPAGATEISPGGGGSDIEPMMPVGVPMLEEKTTGAHYFDWHHTEADTLDKVNPEDFRKNIASLAVMTYILAEMPGRLAGHPDVP